METTMTLRQHRMAQGMTIRELAKAAEVSTQTVVSIEKGRPARMQSYRKLASALGISLMDIREFTQMVMAEP